MWQNFLKPSRTAKTPTYFIPSERHSGSASSTKRHPEKKACEMPNGKESCPLCGALPCDWVDDPHQKYDHLIFTLADIRQVIGVGEKPMLSDLPDEIASRLWRTMDSAPRDGRPVHLLLSNGKEDDGWPNERVNSLWRVGSGRGCVVDIHLQPQTECMAAIRWRPAQ